MKGGRSHAWLAALVLITLFAIWTALDTARPWADWVTLAASPVATPGEPLIVVLKLANTEAPGQIHVSLRTSSSRASNSFSIGEASVPLITGKSTYSTAIQVRPAAPVGYARFTVYLTPTGDWTDRTAVASSDPIRVAPPNPQIRRLHSAPIQMPLFNVTSDSQVLRIRSRTASTLTATLWLVSSALAGRRLFPQTRFLPALSSRREAPFWMVLSATCLTLAISQFTDASGSLAEWARSTARDFNAYLFRENGQQWACAAAVATLMGGWAALFRWRASSTLRICLALASLGLGLDCLDLVSLHALDPWLEQPILGHALLPWLQLIAALAMVVVLLTSRRIPLRSSPTGNPISGS